MKMTLEVDCTGKEMRAFFGLPDEEPRQRAAMAEVEKQMLEAMDRVSPTALMRDWFAPMTAAHQVFLEAFTRSGGRAEAPGESAREESDVPPQGTSKAG